jgi:hypothetical protein
MRLLMLVLLALGCVAGAQRADPKIFVRFHAQTDALDGSFSTTVRLLNPKRDIFVEKVPSLSERDITSFYPYRAPDGTYGVAFQMDRHGQLTLQNLSMQSRGKMLIATVNGRLVTPLIIDKPIRDGIIYVPFGFAAAEIKALGESYKLTSQTTLANKPERDPDMNPLAPTAPSPRQ